MTFQTNHNSYLLTFLPMEITKLQNSSREYCSGLQYNIGHRIPGVHEVTEVYRDLCNLLETHGSEKVENILHDNPVSPIDGD